jgi:tripartite-type tricarboxylate transporter receptor subunit TctC
VAQIDPARFEIVGVCGNSMGWYTALTAGGALPLADGVQLIETFGGWQRDNVIGGQVPLLWVSIPAAAQQVKAGKLRALAVSTLKRSPAFPDVPTMQEAGLKGYEFAPWWGVYFPKGTPDAIVAKMDGWLQQIGNNPETAKFLETVGAIVNKDTGKEADARLAADIEKMGPIIKAAGIEPQ